MLAEHQFGVHPPVPIGAVGRGVDLTDRVHQLRLLPRPAAGRPAVPLVEAGGRDPQDPAGRRDRHPVDSELSDHREDQFWEDVLPGEEGARALEDLHLHLVHALLPPQLDELLVLVAAQALALAHLEPVKPVPVQDAHAGGAGGVMAELACLVHHHGHRAGVDIVDSAKPQDRPRKLASRQGPRRGVCWE